MCVGRLCYLVPTRLFHPTRLLGTLEYFGLPNRRTCAFIYFSLTNRTCAGLLGTVRLFISAEKNKNSRKKMICFHIHSNRPALIINSGKENDLFW